MVSLNPLHFSNAFGDDASSLDLFMSNRVLGPEHRPIPAPEPDPEPNPGPDSGPDPSECHGHGCIHPADWDELFKAIEMRLEDCVCDAVLPLSDRQLNNRHVVTKTIVLECVQAMKQLQAALNVERSERQAAKDLHGRARA